MSGSVVPKFTVDGLKESGLALTAFAGATLSSATSPITKRGTIRHHVNAGEASHAFRGAGSKSPAGPWINDWIRVLRNLQYLAVVLFIRIERTSRT